MPGPAPGTGANAITSTSQTTTTDNCLGFGFTADTTGGTHIATGSGFTTGIAETLDQASEYKTVTPAGSVAATFTDTTDGGTHIYLTMLMAFTPAAAGTPLSVAPAWGDARTGFNQMTHLRM